VNPSAGPVAGPVLVPAEAAAQMTSWGQLAATVSGCVACAELAATRTQVVPGAAPPGAEVLLVGEAPGAQEDAAGVPFVGRSGVLLDELLAEAGLARERVAIANVLKCRPPANRPPRRAEVEHCRPWLTRQLELLDPYVVVSLGSTAAAWFLGPSARIAALRAAPQPLRHSGRPLVVTYHPSAAIRFGPRGAPRAALREDLASVAGLVAQRRAERS
jgi:DNA polymerase